MNNVYVSDFLKAAEEFRSTYGKIADNYMNYEMSAENNRNAFVENNDMQTTRTVSPLDSTISNLEADNAKQDADIASHEATITTLRNGTHPALADLSPEEKQIKAEAMINDFTSRIEMAKEQKRKNNESIVQAKASKDEEIKRNVDFEHKYDDAVLDAEKNYRQEVVDSIKKFKESFNEVSLPDGTKLSNITVIKNEIQKKIVEIQFNRAKAVAEMEKLPQMDPRKGEYGRQLAALSEHLNGLLAFSKGLDSFLALEGTLEKKYIDGSRYPDVVEMQRSFEKMGKLLSSINNNRNFFEKEVSTVVPSEVQQVQQEQNQEPVVQTQEAEPTPVEEKPEEPKVDDSEPAPVEEKPEEPKVETPAVEEPIVEAPAVEEPAVEAPVEAPPAAPEIEENNRSNDDEHAKRHWKYERPGLNFDKELTNRNEAKAVIAKRKWRNHAINAGIAAVALVAASPLYGIPLGTVALVGAGYAAALNGGNLIIDKVRQHAFNYKLDKFLEVFDADLVFDYENKKSRIISYDEDGKVFKFSNYKQMEDKLIDDLISQGLSADEVELQAAKLSKKAQAIFKKATTVDVTTLNFNNGLDQIFDQVGGITRSKSIPEQTIEQGRRYFKNLGNRLSSMIADEATKNKYNLSEQQVRRIREDADKANELSNSKQSELSQTEESMSDVINNIANSKADEFVENMDNEHIVEEDIVNQRSEEEPIVEAPVVEAPVVETPVVETPAVEAPVVEAPVVEAPVVEAPVVEAPVVETPVVEAPVVETPVVEAPVQQPAEPAPLTEEQNIDEEFAPEVREEEPTPESSFDDLLNEDDLMKESEALQNDDIIDVNNNTYSPTVSYEEYDRWINELSGSQQDLDALHVTIGQDKDLTEEQKAELQNKIENLVNPVNEYDAGRSLM